MHCSHKLYDLVGIKLSGEISKLPSSISDSCWFSSVRFFSSPRDGSAQRQCQCLYLWFCWQRNNSFSLGSAFLIIDTLWYGEGLVSALAFWFFCLSSWATPRCTHGNRHHNGQRFRHQPVWQRVVSGNACARMVTLERRSGECLLDIAKRCTVSPCKGAKLPSE